MSSRPRTSPSERLRQQLDNLAMAQHALERRLAKDEEGLRELKTVAAFLGEAISELRVEVELLPRRPGRPLAEISPSFRQKVKELREEREWGRGRIARHLRVPESQVRRVLEELPGAKPSARRERS